MTSINHFLNRTMSLMKAHVQYSQDLANEFSQIIHDYEEFVESEQRNDESPLEATTNSLDSARIQAVCIKIEALMEKEPVHLLRGPDRVNEVDLEEEVDFEEVRDG